MRVSGCCLCPMGVRQRFSLEHSLYIFVQARLLNRYTISCEGRQVATGPIMLVSAGNSYSSQGTNLKYLQISPIPLSTSPFVKS